MAKINAFLHPEAMEEYIASYAWYYERGTHLADEFEREIERAIRLIAESPGRWPAYEKTYRRVLVRRFPFSLIYQVRETDIVVLAVAHNHRLPGYWKNRK